MNSRIEIPKFASEGEEADWWLENRGMVEEQFLEAARTGRLRAGSTAMLRARGAADAITMVHQPLEAEAPGHNASRH